MSEKVVPTTVVIFGASGDLTMRKLIPALFSLCRKSRLPPALRIVGSARSTWSHEEFREEMLAGAKEFVAGKFDSAAWKKFAERLYYVPGDVTKDEDFKTLKQAVTEIEGTDDANRIYYLSIAPRFFATAIQKLGEHNMVSEKGGWKRVIIEKPFGTDLESARQLNQEVHEVLGEHQVYRIDHYLAKETVQNLLVFRFGNTIFEPLWNRNYIDHVQITAAETVDVEHRAGYYDKSGILRDMFQNHLLQLLSMIAMEPPASFDADAIRNEKAKLLSAVRRFTPEMVADYTVRARYEGYKGAEGVDPDSQTATFAVIKLFVDNWRWQGVPFYLRSGKALKKKTTEVIIQFKQPPHMMFPLPVEYAIPANFLAICIQPDEGIHLRFEAKVPDTTADMQSVNMEFHYSDEFGTMAIPEAYERLLLEALEGDASLFTRGDSIEYAWSIIDPILKGWASPAAPHLGIYEKGTWGPQEADEFLTATGQHWRYSCGEHD